MQRCPTCDAELILYPGCPTGIGHCGLCGTLVVGRDLRPSVPRLVALMRDFRAECLRDDRKQCAVYVLAAKVGGVDQTHDEVG